ncbi:eCIS core domain-containing protein [Streptomyces drozdowiczii]|uniref:eCIS core domain-containing protein n=1 Tax=Streptomyces drozdowiczii TaxID=202862 RepID=UPI00403CE1F5
MRGQDGAEKTGADRGGPAAARKPAAAAGVPATELLALQGTLGNAAVVQMLRAAGHPNCGHDEAEHAVQRSAVTDVLRSGGRPLDSAVRSEMESRLGADFSDVRIHTDAAAKASAAEVGARAYTSGHHVVIGDGGADKHTLAHELTHVIQQRRGPVAGTDNGSGLRVSDPSDRFERAAEANATRVMRGPAPVQREELAAAPGRPAQRAVVQRVKLTGYNQGVDYPQGAHTVTINGTAGNVGIKMEGELFAGALGTGEAPQVQPAWWPPSGTPIGDWFKNYMVQGHLLNHNLGGSGKHLENLTPLVRQANSQHHAKVEKKLKAAILQQGHTARYHVTADFSTHPTSADMKMTPGSPEAIAFDSIYRFGLPGKISAEYTLYDAKGKEVGWDSWEIENNNM